MVLHESDLKPKYNILGLLESMDTVDINTKCAAAVPIIEQTIENEKHYLIQLEDLQEYVNSNTISDFGLALNQICESSYIEPTNLIFTIQEYHAIENPNLEILGDQFIQEGKNVRIVPLPSYDPVSIFGNYCLEQMEKDGNYEYWLGDVFCESDYYTYSFKFGRTEPKKLEFHGKEIDGYNDLRRVDGTATEKLNFILQIPSFTKEELNQLSRNGGSSPGFSAVMNTVGEHKVKASTKKFINEWRKDGKSDEEILKMITNQNHTDPFIQSYTRFDQGNMLDPDVQSRIETHNKVYNNIRAFSEKPGDFFSNSKTRTDEAEFNKAKQATLDRLKYAEENLEKFNVDVRGLNDKNLGDAKTRIQKLSRMVSEEKFPKSWLAKKIAWLRGLYRNIMYKLTLHKSDGQWKSVTNPLRSIAGFILRLIDKIALKIQNAVN